MKRVLTLAAVCLLAISTYAADLTVDEILAKNAAARGGADKLRALQSVRFTGKMSIGPMEMPLTLVKKRPEMMKVEFSLGGMTGVQAYDGTGGWMLMPFTGDKDAQKLAGDELAMAKDQADFDGAFFDYAKKGHKVELLGKGDVDGSPAYKLRLTTKDGIETVGYFDATTFLAVKMEAKRKDIVAETLLSNYHDVDGVLFPFSLVMRQTGQEMAQTIVIEKTELNPKLDDAQFKLPAKP
jgi:outer membrane lipoprotein-sorting protein